MKNGMLKYEFSSSDLLVELDVNKYQRNIDFFMKKNDINVVYLTSQDEYLSEYAPLKNHPRYFLTGFDGSAGDLLVIKSNDDSLRFVLFVDGRYHLQADEQSLKYGVEIIKLNLSQSIEFAMEEFFRSDPELNKLVKSAGVVTCDPQRISWGRFRRLAGVCERSGCVFQPLAAGDLSRAIGVPGWSCDREIYQLDPDLTGRSVTKNRDLIAREMQNLGCDPSQTAFISTAADDCAWFLNARGYHLPRQSSILCYLFLINHTAVIFLLPGMDEILVDVPSFLAEFGADPFRVIVVRKDWQRLKEVLGSFAVSAVAFSQKSINAFLPDFCLSVWSQARLLNEFNAVEKCRAQKTPAEISAISESFLRSSRAISRTVQWAQNAVKDMTMANDTEGSENRNPAPTLPTEGALADKIKAAYKAEGALELSFQTIAGVGANGAIIHYGAASNKIALKPGELCLLDSGAYYESGFATDCTRTFFLGAPGVSPQAWQKEIYSLTLKACIKGMRTHFSSQTTGKEIDAIVRSVLKDRGYDYSHGTGHGVGIHVHEDGIRISPASDLFLSEHAVVSIEPGIYLSGKGGVRIENVVVVKRNSEKDDDYYFENLVWVDYDWSLIDSQYFDEDEMGYLRNYQQQCRIKNGEPLQGS